MQRTHFTAGYILYNCVWDKYKNYNSSSSSSTSSSSFSNIIFYQILINNILLQKCE